MLFRSIELTHSYDRLGIDWGLFIHLLVTFRKSWVTTYDSEHTFLFCETAMDYVDYDGDFGIIKY